ncbi:MAG TPA: ABC transporter permease [Kineosporiaceae bacterium]|nr:ABC transporter permease [Kineosporiaceae bacterium]
MVTAPSLADRTVADLPTTVRSGPRYWLDAYLVTARWELANLRLFLPVIVAVQVLAGVGLVLGFGIFTPGPLPPVSVLYVSTGVPVINLYLLGLVLLPQVVGQQRIADTYDFTRSLPVPRGVGLGAWLTVTLAAGIPAMAATLLAAHLRYGFAPHPSAGLLPAVLLVALTATAIGAVLAHVVSQPMVTMMLTQVLNFVAIGFSPVAFPAEQLPGWLAAVNHVLPFESMAVVMRSALSDAPVEGVPRAYAVLSAWSAACVLLAVRALGRRG